MKTGVTARVIQPEIKGQVKERRINKESQELEYLLEWQDGEQLTQRWYDEDELEEVPE